LPKNELLYIFYNGLTIESKTYLDSCAGGVFRKKTTAEAEAEELMAKISQNYDDWTMAEPTPTPTPTPAPTPKKRGII
jgi:hypothetical protein